MSPAEGKRTVVSEGLVIDDATPGHVWDALMGAGAWERWWPDRSPEVADADPPDPARPPGDQAASLKLVFAEDGVEYSFDIYGRVGLTTVNLRRTGPYLGVFSGLQKDKLKRDLLQILVALRDAAKELAPTSPTPALARTTRESFLSTELVANLTPSEAIRARLDLADTSGSSASIPVEVTARFPALCSGCLEDTDRTEETRVGLTVTLPPFGLITTTREWHLQFDARVPLCERCASYGLESLIRIGGYVRPIRDTEWVAFRFPNVAYCLPFLEANGQDVDRITATPKLLRPTLSEGDTGTLTEAIESWESVRDGWGFHRYVDMKTRLVTMAQEGLDEEETTRRLAALAAEQTVDIDRLMEVEDIAREPIAVLHVT